MKKKVADKIKKSIKIINSCSTLDHCIVAQNYLFLLLKETPFPLPWNIFLFSPVEGVRSWKSENEKQIDMLFDALKRKVKIIRHEKTQANKYAG